MKVKELRLLLDKLPDDAPVLHSTGDHEYYESNPVAGTALWSSMSSVWSEDHGEEYTPEAEYGRRYKALLV